MIPQTVLYFRFDKIEDSEGTYYFAPKGFNSGTEYFFGYDMSLYVSKYQIDRDVDLQTDTFTITVEKNFFRNPTRDEKYIKNGQTDITNAFQPNSNHVIVIGNVPSDIGEKSTRERSSYMFEDQEEVSSPVFGIVVKAVDKGSDMVEITCESFLSVLSDFQLSANFNLNTLEDDINTTQVYYEYKDQLRDTSSPFFAAADPLNYDDNESRYRTVKPPTYINSAELLPHYPKFTFNSLRYEDSTLEEEGYESPKIAWRMLQEVGWCRKQFDEEILNYFIEDSANSAVNSFVNPYEIFRIPQENYNQKIMDIVQTPNGQEYDVIFKALDTDGVRYEYMYNFDEPELENYDQTYFKSFDCSKQSILYNLKTLSDTDNLYITVTCCPRIEKNQTTGFYEIVWDKSVYNENPDLYGNMQRWGVYAGFRPKVLIRRNPSDTDEEPTYVVQYGIYSSDPSGLDSSRTLAKGIKWEKDPQDIINNIVVRYGQTETSVGSYFEFPEKVTDTPLFTVRFYGVTDVQTSVRIDIAIGTTYGTYSVNGVFSPGTYSDEVVSMLSYDDDWEDFGLNIYGAGDTLVIKSLYDDVDGDEVHRYWTELEDQFYDPSGAVNVLISYSSYSTGTSFSYATEFIGTEPDSFNTARNSQKEFGIKSTKISLPELTSLNDVIKICGSIFKKLSPAKYRCVTECNDVDGEQLPLFEYFNVIDNSNTKQVYNSTVPASIQFILSGSPTAGSTRITIPIEGSTTPLTFSASNTVGNLTTTMTSVQTAFNNLGIRNSNGDPDPTISITGGTMVFTYAMLDDFHSTDVFYDAGCDGNGISVKRVVNPPQQYIQTEYDENLVLLRYSANSWAGTHQCIFGLPTESLSNLLNQITNWVGDVEKTIK